MFNRNRDEGPPQLSPVEALGYWTDAARTLRQMLAQLDATTPATEQMDGMVEELRDTGRAHLIAANALVGHYTMITADQQRQPVPQEAGGPPLQMFQPRQGPAPAGPAGPPTNTPPTNTGWAAPPVSSVPPARQAAMPAYPARPPQAPQAPQADPQQAQASGW